MLYCCLIPEVVVVRGKKKKTNPKLETIRIASFTPPQNSLLCCRNASIMYSDRMKRREASQNRIILKRQVLCPGLLNAPVCFLGVINNQTLLVTCALSDDISEELQKFSGSSFSPSKSRSYLATASGEKDSICPRQSREAGGSSGKTSGRFCGWLTVRPRFLLTEDNGSPKLGSSASGSRRTGLFRWKFHAVAVLFSVRKSKEWQTLWDIQVVWQDASSSA